MDEICMDNRFKLIEKYKRLLVEATNIEDDKDEMKVIDNILFRIWQMGWLDKLEQYVPVVHGEWIEKEVFMMKGAEMQSARCSVCKLYHTTPYMYYFKNYKYCPNCGAKMDGKEQNDG